MKDILIISNYISTKLEEGNSRFTYLAEMMVKQDNISTVEIVTSSFSHDKKKQRNIEKETNLYKDYKLTMINEPGYKKNICIKRFYSHYILGKSLKKYLKNRKKPDVIYCAVPSLDIAYVAAKYAKKNKVKFIVDIQDLWPEAFKMIINIPYITDLLFKPIEYKANYIYKNADVIIAVSRTYVSRALKVNTKINEGKSVFLGTDLSYFDEIPKNNKALKNKDEVWITYIGTLGHSYNIKMVMDSLRNIQDRGINNVKFMVIGDGPLREQFESYGKYLGINTHFTGMLDYEKMVSYLKISDIAVNPISKGSAASIVNKVGDYAAAGLPVLNTQESEEYRNLIDEYNCGLNCENGDVECLSNHIMYLYSNEEIRRQMGENNRKLAELKFNREKTYKEIIDLI